VCSKRIIRSFLWHTIQYFKGYGWFHGEVTSVITEDELFWIAYEDDDSETVDLKDLKKILIKDTDKKYAADSDEEDYRMEDIDGIDDDDDDEDDDPISECGDDDSEDDVVKVNAKANTTPTKAKRSVSLVSPSPKQASIVRPKKKPKPKGTTTTSSSNQKTTKPGTKPRTIAFRGLPRGALAKCNTSGLVIRSLESISPLFASSSVSFLHAVPNPDAPNTKKATNASNKVASLDTPLSGKFLIVHLDDHQDDICPTDYVGKTFASAAELYKQLPNSQVDVVKVNYNMEVVADPVFAPWEFVQARLGSSGLLDVDDSATVTDLGPFIFVVQLDWDGCFKVSGNVYWYKDYINSIVTSKDDLHWAIVEASQRDTPAVLLGVPLDLLEHSERNDNQHQTEHLDQLSQGTESNNESEDTSSGCDNDLIPPPSSKVANIQLPASLLQKAIRRGNGLCSVAPFLEACEALLLPKESSDNCIAQQLPEGSTLAMLKTVWGCMLVDASPFEDADGCLGLPSLMLLSLVAKADPQWRMPVSLCRAAVAGGLRTAKSAPSQPWLGFVERSDNWWMLEAAEPSSDAEDQKACYLRNTLRAVQAAVGGRIAWGKWNSFAGDASAAAVLAYLNGRWKGSYLRGAPPPVANEDTSLQIWETRRTPIIPPGPIARRLDEECRLAAVEPAVMPSTLVLLQALLSEPPTKWKKHGLPSLSKQVRKLISEANARIKERVQLARLATWGKEAKTVPERQFNDSRTLQADGTRTTEPFTASYKSFREVVTPTGTLSEKETEVVDCFEAIQEWVAGRVNGITSKSDRVLVVESLEPTKTVSSPKEFATPQFTQVKAGPPLTPYDKRVAFLLAFATSLEIEVCVDHQSPSSKEVVSAMFCGDAEEPLLVQRIGRARKEGKEAATAGGTTSGATAVPSLGYVQRGRSAEEAKLIRVVEVAVAEHWKGGKTTPLPLPPAGLQWDLPGDTGSNDLGWQSKDVAVTRTAELVEDETGKRSWKFSIAGEKVDAFDAGTVVSPCALDLDDPDHRPEQLQPGTDREQCLRIAFYVKDGTRTTALPHGKVVLETLALLHTLAESDRKATHISEGRVFDWMPLALDSLLPPRTWRDALLAIRTRENDFVVLGKGVGSDGTGAPRDMVEGVLVRVFHGLELLYPQAIRKEGALKFRIRPRGAAYYHLLASLERLGRGELTNRSSLALPAKSSSDRSESKRRAMSNPEIDEEEESQLRKRPRRAVVVAASKKAAAMVEDDETLVRKAASHRTEVNEAYTANDAKSDSEEGESAKETLPLPKIKTSLWPHQEQSVSKVVEGVRQGRRGHADASAVGAGKTLTALATIVRLAEWIESSGRSRHGVLVMLPTKALIKEWLLEIAAHTEGFHIVEQREDGTLFSLTYGKTHPPIDGNTLIISTLDRVCNHPFVRQSAWDFVVIDECLSVQNAAAKRK